MMDDLLAFVRQQLDEDERMARRTSMPKEPLAWHYDREHFTVRADDPDEYPVAAYRDRGESSLLDVDGEHIARWNPARVLAEVEAKRRILDLHVGQHDCPEMHTGVYPADWPESAPWGKAGERWHHPSVEHFEADQACPTVSLLAQPYAGQPGWREEWQDVSNDS